MRLVSPYLIRVKRRGAYRLKRVIGVYRPPWTLLSRPPSESRHELSCLIHLIRMDWGSVTSLSSFLGLCVPNMNAPAKDGVVISRKRTIQSRATVKTGCTTCRLVLSPITDMSLNGGFIRSVVIVITL